MFKKKPVFFAFLNQTSLKSYLFERALLVVNLLINSNRDGTLNSLFGYNNGIIRV